MHDSPNFSSALLKAYISCSQGVMDIDINKLPHVLHLHLALHNYCELQKKTILEQSLALALTFEKQVHPAEVEPRGILR